MQTSFLIEQQNGSNSFPLGLLLDHAGDEEAQLQELHAELTDRYATEGVTLALTGPWPPYTFV